MVRSVRTILTGATVYYYILDDGRYQRVTVVDGDVVDVQIVDEIA